MTAALAAQRDGDVLLLAAPQQRQHAEEHALPEVWVVVPRRFEDFVGEAQVVGPRLGVVQAPAVQHEVRGKANLQ